jgi:hypothetical protein
MSQEIRTIIRNTTYPVLPSIAQYCATLCHAIAETSGHDCQQIVPAASWLSNG